MQSLAEMWSLFFRCGLSLSQKKGFRSCDSNSVFFCVLILKEVLELNGIVQIIVRSAWHFVSSFDHANGLSIFQIDAV